MVSRKWTCQLSFGLALPIDAAQPPSAITVWALPNNDLRDHGDLEATLTRLDHRAQSRAAGTDDDDVVLSAVRLPMSRLREEPRAQHISSLAC